MGKTPVALLMGYTNPGWLLVLHCGDRGIVRKQPTRFELTQLTELLSGLESIKIPSCLSTVFPFKADVAKDEECYRALSEAFKIYFGQIVAERVGRSKKVVVYKHHDIFYSATLRVFKLHPPFCSCPDFALINSPKWLKVCFDVLPCKHLLAVKDSTYWLTLNIRQLEKMWWS